MSSAVQGLLSTLANIVSGLSPLAKAIVAALLPLASALVNMAFAGSFDTTSIVVLATGVIAALAVYVIPNKPNAAVVVPVAPAAGAK